MNMGVAISLRSLFPFGGVFLSVLYIGHGYGAEDKKLLSLTEQGIQSKPQVKSFQREKPEMNTNLVSMFSTKDSEYPPMISYFTSIELDPEEGKRKNMKHPHCP